MSEGTQSDYISENECSNNINQDIDMDEIENEIKLDSQIFTSHQPVIGKIPMVFYVPACAQYEELQKIIMRNGGRVVDQHECFTFQIKPEAVKTGFQDYFKGTIYSSKWIIDSVAAQKCLNKDDYFVCINIDDKSKMLNIGKKKKYTIIEGIKLYETITNQKNLQINSNQFWQKAQKQGILPERTAESMRTFWKKNQYKTLEEFLIDCIHEETDFCLSFKEIPNKEFVNRFKQQYSNEFLKLKTLESLNKVGSDEDEEMKALIMLQQSNKNLGKQLVPNPTTPLKKTNSSNNLTSILSASLKPDNQEKVEEQKDIQMVVEIQEESKELLKYEFKKIQKLQNMSYSPFEYEISQPHIYFSIDSRSLEVQSLEQELENQLSQRMKKYIPSNFDLVDYDKELFKKQMDLEIVRITINRDEEREKEYDIAPYYVRSVQRMENEEGMFRRLQLELQQIGQQYGVSDEEVNRLFLEVCCSKGKLLEALQGQSFTKWNELEDMALQRGTESQEYNYLLKTKGYEEILRRKKFLGI